MAILTPDYERMQNGQPQDYNTTKQYRKEFADQDIASAQALITSDNSYLVMDADKLNDLCDTIDYMQQVWANDKEEFANKYLRMTAPMVVGRNLIDPITININQNGITLTPNDDGVSMTLNGTATNSFQVVLCNVDSPVPYNNASIFDSMVTGGLFSDSSLESPIQSALIGMEYDKDDGGSGGVLDYGVVSRSYLHNYQWKLKIAFKAGDTFDNMQCYPIFTCGIPHTSGLYSYNGDTQYHLNYIYNTGDLVLYNGDPYFCISDNTTGEWDDTKWLRIGDDDVGLVFAGLYDPLAEYLNGVLVVDGYTGGVPSQPKVPVTWEYKMNDNFTQCGATYPNMRYLTSSQTPYTSEIYMTDWNGGGA